MICIGSYAFRFPRRAAAVALIEAEMRALPALGARLPLPIPRPDLLAPAEEKSAAPDEGAAEAGGAGSAQTRAGRGPDYRWPFYGHAWLEGETADRAGLDGAQRAALAAPLGRFLRALHAIGEREGRALGLREPSLRLTMRERADRARARLALACEDREKLAALPVAIDLALVEQVRDALAGPEPEAGARHEAAGGAALESRKAAPGAGGRVCAIHGDLYARHLLLARGSAAAPRLAGVIDWGDVALGDPAEDLALAFSFLPAAARPDFFAAYGHAGEAELLRARWSALSRYTGSLLAYAIDVADEPLLREAQAAARLALE